MSTIAGFSWFDLILMAVLVMGLMVGYGQGLVRQVLGLGVLYIGTILGAQYFSVVAGLIQYVFGNASVNLVNAIGFFLVLLIVSAMISWLVFDAYHVRQLKHFPRLDHIGGRHFGAVHGRDYRQCPHAGPGVWDERDVAVGRVDAVFVGRWDAHFPADSDL